LIKHKGREIVKDIIDQLQDYANILINLKEKGVVRTFNSPVGDFAEWYVAQKFNLTLEHNSKAGYDAIDSKGVKYQIKARWIHEESKNANRRLSVIRNLEKKDFDILIGIIFDEDFGILEAYKIHIDNIIGLTNKNEYQNGHIITLTPKLWKDGIAEDITQILK
jgi:hypothetical protein